MSGQLIRHSACSGCQHTDDVLPGWGNWVNTAVLALLLLILGQTGPDAYQQEQLEVVGCTCNNGFLPAWLTARLAHCALYKTKSCCALPVVTCPIQCLNPRQVWRLSFFLGLVPVAGMLCWRLFKLEESTMWRDKQKRLQQEVHFPPADVLPDIDFRR